MSIELEACPWCGSDDVGGYAGFAGAPYADPPEPPEPAEAWCKHCGAEWEPGYEPPQEKIFRDLQEFFYEQHMPEELVPW